MTALTTKSMEVSACRAGQPNEGNRRLSASPSRGRRRPTPVRCSRRTTTASRYCSSYRHAAMDRHMQRTERLLCGGRLCAAERPGRANGDERRWPPERNQRCCRLLQRARPGHLHQRIHTAQVHRSWPGIAPHDGRETKKASINAGLGIRLDCFGRCWNVICHRFGAAVRRPVASRDPLRYH